MVKKGRGKRGKDKQKRVGGLHKNSTTSRFLKEVEAGAKMTIKEWANKFGVSYVAMESSLGTLRRRGLSYHPYQGEILVKGVKKTGIVVLVSRKEEWAVSAMNTYEDKHSLPLIKGQFRMFSAILKEQPQLATEITSFAENLMLEAINANKTFNANKRLLLTEKN